MSVLEGLNRYKGKRVRIVFESKVYNGLYYQTGILLRANETWTYVDDWTGRTTYPRGSASAIKTSRIREVREISLKMGDMVRVSTAFCIVPDILDWLIEQKTNQFEVTDVNEDNLKVKLKGVPFEMDIDTLELVDLPICSEPQEACGV